MASWENSYKWLQENEWTDMTQNVIHRALELHWTISQR